MIYIGDDPGASGAIVVLGDDAEVIGVLRKSKSTLNDRCQFVADILREQEHNNSYCVLEKVSASPQMGVTSAFKFGGEFHGSQMLYAALGVRFELHTPQVWQKELGLTSVKKSDGDTAKKRYLREAAERLFPHENIFNDTADAYLIAWYARKVWMGREFQPSNR